MSVFTGIMIIIAFAVLGVCITEMLTDNELGLFLGYLAGLIVAAFLAISLVPSTEKYCENLDVKYEYAKAISEITDIPIQKVADILHHCGLDAFELTPEQYTALEVLYNKEK